jgi:hypothetical protein
MEKEVGCDPGKCKHLLRFRTARLSCPKPWRWVEKEALTVKAYAD